MKQTKDRQFAALRLYFPIATRARSTRLWHRLSPPALAHHLLNVAKRAELIQAILHPVTSGYLPGERMSHHHPELVSMRHPQCLELLDTGACSAFPLRASADLVA
jgi:hypothetical protein